VRAVAALLLLAAAAAIWSVAGAQRHTRQLALSKHGLMSLPVAARGPISAALGRAEPSYRVLGLRARNAAQRLGVAFSRTGVTVTSGKTRVQLALLAYGHGSALGRVRSVSPEVLANRVAYAYPGVREWYANGPLGLEQGFDVAGAPARGQGPLTLSLALSGDVRARLWHSGVLLKGPGAALRYGGLSVIDARGRTLDSWLELRSRRLLIRVDDRGAVYPLKVDPLLQQAELRAADGAAGDGLGFAVAVSGNTIVAGAPRHAVGANARQGAAYVFTMPASGWANATQSAELTASDGGAEDGLGSAVAVSGSTIVAGAPRHAVGGKAGQGRAYVFTMPASGWANATQSAELTASDGGAEDGLGSAVAVSGNTIVAGAPRHAVGAKAGQGAAYVFTMPASGWANATQSAELTAADGGARDGLGSAVAVSGNTIVAGARFHYVTVYKRSGAAYVFTMPASGWANATQTAELTASDARFAQDELGFAVAVSGATIVAGAPFHEVGINEEQGAAYVFSMPAAGWANATQSAELTASDGGAEDGLGSAVAVSGATIVAGAPFHAAGINAEQGAAYVFTMPAAGWANATQIAELTASDGVAEDGLGSALALSGNTIVAGAPNHKVGANAERGAAYVFANPPPTVANGSPAGSGGALPLGLSPVRPTISSAHQSHSIWREGSRLAQISAKKKKPPVGTTFSFSLNEPAAISFSFTQSVRSKVKGKCVAHAKKNRRRPACKHIVTVGTLSFTGHSGTNKVNFQGRTSRSKKLKPGRYTLIITASNSVGYSTPRSLTFTIVK
jgi:trimeric autotransporter adhesin